MKERQEVKVALALMIRGCSSTFEQGVSVLRQYLFMRLMLGSRRYDCRKACHTRGSADITFMNVENSCM